jgi:hypothetical protein
VRRRVVRHTQPEDVIMSSDRIKATYRRRLEQKGQLSLEYIRPVPTPSPLMVARGRYVRFSHRYNCWQVNKCNSAGYMEWRNISANLAQCYAAAGLPIQE